MSGLIIAALIVAFKVVGDTSIEQAVYDVSGGFLWWWYVITTGLVLTFIVSLFGFLAVGSKTNLAKLGWSAAGPIVFVAYSISSSLFIAGDWLVYNSISVFPTNELAGGGVGVFSTWDHGKFWVGVVLLVLGCLTQINSRVNRKKT